MAREIILSSEDYPGSNTLYWVGYRVSDSKYIVGTSLATYNSTHWATYAHTLTLDAGTQEYFGNFPQVSNADYLITIFEQIGASPATTDTVLAEGVFSWTINPTNVAGQFELDASVFLNLNEFAEQVTYTPFGGEPATIPAIITRNLPDKVEDGRNLVDLIEAEFANDATLGTATIQPGRDTITCAGRYGGPATAHTITAVVSGDQGMWRVRMR